MSNISYSILDNTSLPSLNRKKHNQIKWFLSKPHLIRRTPMILNAIQVAHLKTVSWSDQSDLVLCLYIPALVTQTWCDKLWQEKQKTTNMEDTQREYQCLDQLQGRTDVFYTVVRKCQHKPPYSEVDVCASIFIRHLYYTMISLVMIADGTNLWVLQK